jgi:hypothetical protein
MKNRTMPTQFNRILTQITDHDDLQTLMGLIDRYTGLREALANSAKLQSRVQKLEADNAAMQKKVHEWKEWADLNVPKHNYLLADHERLSDRVKELEIELRRALALIPATNDILFQTE